MDPVTQSKTGKKNGNCLSACFASLLELPLSSVPDFGGVNWLAEVARFLEPFGLAYIQVPADTPALKAIFDAGEMYCTIEGISPRGGPHACVAKCGKLVWDPHPQDGTGRGLARVKSYGLLVSRMNAASFAGLEQVNSNPRYEVI